MCGIFGSTFIIKSDIIEKKLDCMRSRGPDYQDYKLIDNKIIFGHTRLAIIDLDPRSNQPFQYQHIVIIYNGEIYNYRDIKEELKSRGYVFKTSSDTEVICAAYLEYGENVLSHLNGMFSFAIYDIKKKIIFCARDRLGKKPFYYMLNKKGFEFASRLSAIRISNKLTVDEKSIIEYLNLGYIPDPNSAFTEVKRLRAGHFLVYDLAEKKLRIEKYWDLNEAKDIQLQKLDYQESIMELENLLRDSVRIRMIADVPLGVFLSGGVDSSLIAAFAQSITTEQIKTFTISFDEKGFDESNYALAIAQHLNTNHTTIPYNFNEAIDLIHNFYLFYDEPFADTAAIPQLLLSKYTRKEVTVSLSGDGGDEMFLGYSRYPWLMKLYGMMKIPYGLRNTYYQLSRVLPDSRFTFLGKAIRYKDFNETIYSQLQIQDKKFINGEFQSDRSQYIKFLESDLPVLQKIADLDIKLYLNDAINTKVDRASMGYSLEIRSPIMDYRIVEFARGLPVSFRYTSQVQKRILKDLLYNYIPQKLIDRPKKGFTPPLKTWFRNELREYIQDNLNYQALKSIPYINPDRVYKHINYHINGRADYTQEIWRILVLQQWLANYV